MNILIELSDEDIELLHQVVNEFNYNTPYELKTVSKAKLLQLLTDKIHQAKHPELFTKGNNYEHLN